MTIAFVCPNGHQLNAPMEMAGKAGKCPKCGVKFLVPPAEDPVPEPSTPISPSQSGSSLGGPKPSPSSSGVGSKSKSGINQGEVFVFLCPNGHRLNGPPSLKGKAGQCPHCGAKFLIPSDDDVPQPQDEMMLPEDVDPEQEIPQIEEETPIVEVVNSWRLPPPEPTGGHRLAELTSWIWAQKSKDSSVELVMKDGQIFKPTMYSPELSYLTHGVFVNKDETTGKFTMVTVCWDNVVQMVVKNLDEIPHSLFG